MATDCGESPVPVAAQLGGDHKLAMIE